MNLVGAFHFNLVSACQESGSLQNTPWYSSGIFICCWVLSQSEIYADINYSIPFVCPALGIFWQAAWTCALKFQLKLVLHGDFLYCMTFGLVF